MNAFNFTELIIKIESHFSKIEREFRTSWEQTRFIAYNSVLPHVSSKNKSLKPTDLIKFEWDSEKKQRELHEKDFETMELMDQIIQGKYKLKQF